MKTKQEQIEEMCEAIASMICQIYNPQCDEYEPHTCSHCYANDTLIGDFAEMLYNAGYRKEQETAKEIERLKAENKELTKVVSSKVYDLIDNTKEIADAREAWGKQAQIEVLNRLKSLSIYDDNYLDGYVFIDDIEKLLEELKK